MIAVPRWLSFGTTCVITLYSISFSIATMIAGRFSSSGVVGLVLFVVAFLLGILGRPDQRTPLWRAIVVTGIGVLLPVLGSVGLDPSKDTYTSGAWYIGAVACLTVQLLWRRRRIFAWVVIAALVVHTCLWGGAEALVTFAVVAVVLIIAVVTASGLALEMTQRELARYSSARREAIEWGAAQEAYHIERQVRLSTTARLASPLLARIAETDHPLAEAERFECRVLGQSIRDEIRGRRLLNDALREQLTAHRRRGAMVQVNDDGGIDDLSPDIVEPMIDRVAAAITGLQSDRIVIRAGARDSPIALSVVAMSSDPIAAALGIADDDERVDLWLEIERPVLVNGS